MNHDWMIEVLRDLRAYALAHGLTATADKADETLRVAVLEIGAPDPADLSGLDKGH